MVHRLNPEGVCVSEIPPFVEFAKIARLKRDMIVTEKLDGTNAQVTILDDGTVLAGSRSRWIEPNDATHKGNDNFGFAAWVRDHKTELLQLGPGTHFGEWWGRGIQRGYGLTEKRFSLFNVGRWDNDERPACCHIVPVIERYTFDSRMIEMCKDRLLHGGSFAAPGFMQPEGLVVFHVASGQLFKYTLDKNDGHKGA